MEISFRKLADVKNVLKKGREKLPAFTVDYNANPQGYLFTLSEGHRLGDLTPDPELLAKNLKTSMENRTNAFFEQSLGFLENKVRDVVDVFGLRFGYTDIDAPEKKIHFYIYSKDK